MSHYDAEMAYCAWRLKLYTYAKRMTYRDIDRAVSEGMINPTMTPEQCCVALGFKLRPCAHEFVEGKCRCCGYPGV